MDETLNFFFYSSDHIFAQVGKTCAKMWDKYYVVSVACTPIQKKLKKHDEKSSVLNGEKMLLHICTDMDGVMCS